jgi:hypothetical protein
MDDRNTFTKNGNFENIKKVLYNILFNWYSTSPNELENFLNKEKRI